MCKINKYKIIFHEMVFKIGDVKTHTTRKSVRGCSLFIGGGGSEDFRGTTKLFLEN